MTDVWCFTCDHELQRKLGGGYEHLHQDEAEACVCTEDEIPCEPR
jgi:hypothetical protein